jgi:hypothetical protein
MRHVSLEMTMRYYVVVNAYATADELLATIGGNLGGALEVVGIEISEKP